jgi:hypothetical protein
MGWRNLHEHPNRLPPFLPLPLLLQASMEAAIQQQPTQFFVAKTKWTGGTEEALDAVLEHLQQRQCLGQQPAPVQ